MVALSWHKNEGGLQALTFPDDGTKGAWDMKVLSTFSRNEQVSIGDVDRDAAIDLLVGDHWLRNTGEGWTSHALGKVNDVDKEAEPDRNRLVDINGDGWLDAVVSRYLQLGIALTVVYGLITLGYLMFLFTASASAPPAVGSPLALTIASLTMIVLITLVNFVYLLMPIVMAAEDCTIVEAMPHVGRLIRRRTKELGQVLAAILALMLLATGASILATTALGLIAFVPFVGLAALPLQVFAWLVRGVVFQFVGLTGVATYVRLHFALHPASVHVRTSSDGLEQITRA
jgi:hypothetical protein